MNANLVLFPGDGIGPEVIEAAVKTLEFIAAKYGHNWYFNEQKIGGASMDAHGVPLTDAALAASQKADAVLLGAVGGPKWDNPAAKIRPEQGLLQLRKGLGVFANLRPIKVYPQLIDFSPLKAKKLAGVDLLVVRELTGGLYFGEPKGRSIEAEGERAVDTLVYYDFEIERVLELAFQLADGRRKQVALVDKANVLESSRLWRQVASQVKGRYPQVEMETVLVDTAAMRLVSNPVSFDVLVTENMFGDILTDEASVISGSMGLLPSASIGNGGPGLYEPIHGSAPDIAGQGIANPIGAILSAALLLRHSLNLPQEANAIERAVELAIDQGFRTRDLGGTLGAGQITAKIIENIDKF